MNEFRLYWGTASCCLCTKQASVVLVIDDTPRNTYCTEHRPRLVQS